jgi:hypothetical protein
MFPLGHDCNADSWGVYLLDPVQIGLTGQVPDIIVIRHSTAESSHFAMHGRTSLLSDNEDCAVKFRCSLSIDSKYSSQQYFVRSTVSGQRVLF